MKFLRTYWTFARPFTLVPPMTGIFSGALLGYGATHAAFHPVHVTLAVLAAGVLNAASNVLNQICDLTNDRINKPHRPLPSGKITMRQAWVFTAALYALALAMVAVVNRQTFAIYVIAALATVAYSAPSGSPEAASGRFKPDYRAHPRLPVEGGGMGGGSDGADFD